MSASPPDTESPRRTSTAARSGPKEAGRLDVLAAAARCSACQDGSLTT
jgi:hypothetical protein